MPAKEKTDKPKRVRKEPRTAEPTPGPRARKELTREQLDDILKPEVLTQPRPIGKGSALV